MKLLPLLLSLTFIIGCQTDPLKKDPPEAKIKAPVGTTVVIDTSRGSILVELDDKKAPVTVKNFLSYVDQGFYDNTTFHRVISHFMIQGGGHELMKMGVDPAGVLRAMGRERLDIGSLQFACFPV